jgi:hypothetical protein
VNATLRTVKVLFAVGVTRNVAGATAAWQMLPYREAVEKLLVILSRRNPGRG